MTTKKKNAARKKTAPRPAKKRVGQKKAPAKKNKRPAARGVDGDTGRPLGKEALFCTEYLVDLNATAAARRAGYSARSAGQIGYRLLTKDHIQTEITLRRNELFDRVDLNASKVINELKKVGFANLHDYIRITADGEPFVDLSNMTRDQAAALNEVTVEDFKDGRGDDTRDVRRVRLKMASKLDALEKLGKYLGLFVDRVDLTARVKLSRIERVIVDPKQN